MAAPLYKPSKWQEEFHSLTVREALGAGSAGPGKSLTLLMDPMSQVLTEHNRCLGKHPSKIAWGSSVGWALHLRREFPRLEHTIARSMRMFPQIDPGARWEDKKKLWTFSSGYRFQFGHCASPGDWVNFLSAEFTHIGFDELVEFEEEQYDQITSRLRTSDPVLRTMLKIRSASNPIAAPGVRNPYWVRSRFVDPAPEGRVILKSVVKSRDGQDVVHERIYLPATLYDNPDPQFVKDFEATLLHKPAHIRQAMLYGNWYVTAGSFYGEEWLDRLHVVRPFKIPADWPRFRSMDWGFKSHGCVHWWAMDEDENLYCERELTFRNLDAKQVALRIKEIEEDAGLWDGKQSQITGPADTQLWEQRGDVGKSKAEEMADVGVYWVRADKRSRARNAERFLARLMDHDGGTSTPGIVFFQTCKMAIRTIPSIQADKNNPNEPQEGGDDHWHDSVVYACAFASRGRIGIPNRVYSSRRFDDDIEDRRDRGRWGYGSF